MVCEVFLEVKTTFILAFVSFFHLFLLCKCVIKLVVMAKREYIYTKTHIVMSYSIKTGISFFFFPFLNFLLLLLLIFFLCIIVSTFFWLPPAPVNYHHHPYIRFRIFRYIPCTFRFHSNRRQRADVC